MKTRKYLYITLGALAIFFYTGGMYMILTIVEKNTPAGSTNYTLFTQQVLLVFGLLFFRAAYRVHKKINQQKRQDLENAFSDQ